MTDEAGMQRKTFPKKVLDPDAFNLYLGTLKEEFYSQQIICTCIYKYSRKVFVKKLGKDQVLNLPIINSKPLLINCKPKLPNSKPAIYYIFQIFFFFEKFRSLKMKIKKPTKKIKQPVSHNPSTSNHILLII